MLVLPHHLSAAAFGQKGKTVDEREQEAQVVNSFLLYLHTGWYLQLEGTHTNNKKKKKFFKKNHTGMTTQPKKTAARTRSTQSVLLPTCHRFYKTKTNKKKSQSYLHQIRPTDSPEHILSVL